MFFPCTRCSLLHYKFTYVAALHVSIPIQPQASAKDHCYQMKKLKLCQSIQRMMPLYKVLQFVRHAEYIFSRTCMCMYSQLVHRMLQILKLHLVLAFSTNSFSFCLLNIKTHPGPYTLVLCFYNIIMGGKNYTRLPATCMKPHEVVYLIIYPTTELLQLHGTSYSVAL